MNQLDVTHEYPCRGPLFGQAHFTILADNVTLQTTLRRCNICQTIWETMEHKAWVASNETAKRDFPGLILSV